MISFMISHLISHMNLQVDDAEKALKMKIRPRNAFLSCYKLNFLAAMPREELHQFLIGLYGEISSRRFSTQSNWCYTNRNSSSVPMPREFTSTWWPMKCWRMYGCASAIACHRWTRQRRSCKWPLSMWPTSTTCMSKVIPGSIWRVIASGYCFWTFLLCFAT